MRLRLTDLAVRKLSLTDTGQRTYWDDHTPGFGVRCSTRSKSFIVMYGSKRRLKTLGRHPDLSLADARKRAKIFLGNQLHIGEGPRQYDYRTVLHEYLEDCQRRLRPSTLEGYQQYLTKIAFSGPVHKVGRREVLRAIQEYTGSPSSQNYAFTTFKVFFNWLVRQQYLAANPLQALNRPNQASKRDRVLSEAELGILLRHLQASPGRFQDLVQLLILTGQRRGEIASLRWSDIDGDMLHLPADRTKNKHAHEIPLPQQALALLERIESGSIHVFGTPDEDQPFNGWARAQRRLLRETALDHFTLHDLRRTFATMHAQLGTPLHVTERLLNHRSGTISGVAAVYNRHSYLEEMRVAMERYDEHLAKLAPDG